MAKMIFVNLPVADLAVATRFYEAIGCKKNPQFSDANAASMVWSDTITFQLLTREYFKTFTAKPISEAHHERMDIGWLYNRAVEDPDGPILELVWMEMGALTNAQGEHA
jgi:uncharacterized protein